MPYKKVGTEEVDILNYFCDGCGGEFNNYKINVETDNYNTLTTDFEFGYGTKRDGQIFKYTFCNHCAEDILHYIEILRSIKEPKENVI